MSVRSRTSQTTADLLTAVPHDPRWQSPPWRSRVRKNLGKWFSENARTLPWRSDPTPYNVWVSEIMLQQTQVATVLPYFERFLKQFPHIEKLANADDETLLAIWQGLGYYRRVRLMRDAARHMTEHHRGQFPRRFEDILALPGIGRYTAGAIASIALGQRRPIVEGNTVRVFARWTAMRTPPREKNAEKFLWHFSETMLPRSAPGDFNQAAMELGALICRVKPQCDICPVKNQCAARELGLVDEVPGKVSTVQYESRREYAFVIESPRRPRDSALCRAEEGTTTQDAVYLLHRRPDRGRWAGLWDWPRPIEFVYGSPEAALESVTDALGVSCKLGVRLATLNHGVTKYRITLDVHRATLGQAPSTPPNHHPRLPDGWRWATLHEMRSIPMPVTANQIAERLTKSSQTELPLFSD